MGLVHTNIREERGLKAFHQRLVSDVIGREMRENAGFHVSFVVDMDITSPPGDTAVNKRGVRPKVHDIERLLGAELLDEFSVTVPLFRRWHQIDGRVLSNRHKQEIPSVNDPAVSPTQIELWIRHNIEIVFG
jgi:hypothetical protein